MILLTFTIYFTSFILFTSAFDQNACWTKKSNAEFCFHRQMEELNSRRGNDLKFSDYPNVVVITVASNETDGYLRFKRSAQLYDIPVKTLGLESDWKGGSMKTTGGGQKINLLRNELIPLKDDQNTIVLFTDSYDVVFLSGLDQIVEKFMATGARVLFGSESSCWPDMSLASKYPPVEKGKQFLNSGGFIGFAADVFSVVAYKDISDKEDDQLYYTKIYLDDEMRAKHKIQLDHTSSIFINLFGAEEEIDLKWSNNEAQLVNTAYDTTPNIMHGNGISKLLLNSLTNYVPRTWVAGEGCVACKQDMIKLDADEKLWPTVLLAVFVNKPTPFFEEFLRNLKNLQYPRKKIDVFLFNAVKEHEEDLDEFIRLFAARSVKRVRPGDNVDEIKARSLAIDHFVNKDSGYYFNVDGEARLDNPHTLKLLIEQNRRVVAPLLVRPYKAWSNFWGGLTKDGYYARSPDYMDIVNNNKRGLWNVPYITACYLINGTVIRNPSTRPKFSLDGMDQDMALSHHFRTNGVFMYVNNRVDFGHLIDPDDFDITRKNPDFYNLFQNQWDWEQRYIHVNYSKSLEASVEPNQPCPDVYWFPIVSPRFCTELIGIMENFGQWSDGSNKDERLGGGYEAVPTRDIHMNQVGLEKQWLQFLKLFVLPLNQRVFLGYQDNPPRSIMNFVVRYRPDEQPSLRPHHDTSTYTINIALNTPKVDFEGGGCKFLRYNCSVVDTRLGWLLMHPGRLTHIHEGLLVTKGTRYIMISFIDP